MELSVPLNSEYEMVEDHHNKSTGMQEMEIE